LAVALGAPRLDFADVAEALDAGGELDEGAEIRQAHHLAFDHFADLVRGHPVGPDVVDLLDAEGEAAVLHVDLEDLGLDGFALAQNLAGVLRFIAPTDVGDVDQALDALLDFDEGAEIGHAADAPSDDEADGIFVAEGEPGIGQGLLHAERDAALLGIDLEDFHLELVAEGDDLGGMLGALRPGHLADVDQALDAGVEFDEGAVVGDAHDFADEAHAGFEALRDIHPGIGHELFASERDAHFLAVELEHARFD